MDTRLGVNWPASQRGWWIAMGLGICFLLVGIGLLLIKRSHSTQTPQGESRAKQSAMSARRSTGVIKHAPGDRADDVKDDGHGPRFDDTTCWPALFGFDEAVTIESFRTWAAALFASKDEHVLTYLKERLTELIGADGQRAVEVLGWVRDANGKEAGLFLSALRGAEAIHLPQVSKQLTTMSLDSTIPLERRAGILAALDTQKRFEPAVLGRLEDLARDTNSGEAGWAATRTIGRVMETDYLRTGNATPYLDALLHIGSASTDDDVRYLAISMPMHTDPLLDKEATLRYAKILTTEGSANGRDAAANIMSLSQDKATVLEIFARAFRADTDVCVRWALFRFAARAAERAALPTMADMATVDPRFQPDYQIFEQIYASGVVDFERVWLSLPDQDPHGCLHRPD